MWNEIKLVAWKERIQSFSNKEIIVGIGLLPIIYGVMFPFVFNADKALSGISFYVVILCMCFIGVLDASIQTVYAFAGEREANTLPTLLTTRISDSSLVLGKGLYCFMTGLLSSLIFFVLYAGITFFAASQGGQQHFLLAQKDINLVVALVILPILFTLFSTSIGMLISTKVRNTKMGAGLATLPELPFVGLLGWFLLGNPLNIPIWANLLVIYIALILLTVMTFMLTVGLFNREKMTLRQ